MSAAEHSLELTSGWELALAPGGPWQPATVPGNWYLDGIDGPETVWYRCTFEVPEAWAGRSTRLRFDAVDYHAEVHLDGRALGTHNGGFAPFDFDLGVLDGRHELLVEVRCPIDPYGAVWPHSKTTLRGVMGHHDARPGGWSERGQERSTGGIWGKVALTALDPVSIETVRVTTELGGADALLRADLRVLLLGDDPRWATVSLRLTEEEGRGEVAHELWTDTWLEPGDNDVVVTGRVAAPRLWWTWDHGEAHRYALDTAVLVDEEIVTAHRQLVGLRSIEVGPDWVWRLNGRPVFIRGVNYIGEQWLSQLTPDRAAGDVGLAVEANLNAIRVHAHVTAPGVYDACDERGVLVWQDLPMQWGYADTAETYRVARAMVGEIIEQHGWRPSVALWCAHNEAPWNEPWMAEEAGGFRPDQNQRLDHELAARFRDQDPSRPAVANSGAGDGHTYPGWYWGRWTDVKELPGGAFVSEYGAQAVPDLETLRTFLGADATLEDWSYHGFQRHEVHTMVGVNLLENTVEEVVEATQRYQARLLQFATEVYRRKKGERVQGVMPFMLVDPWPCVSWSVLDHRRQPKLGYHALARAMQPVLPSIEAEDATYRTDDPPTFGIWWINDHHRAFRDAVLSWTLVDDRGSRRNSHACTVHVLPDAARRVLQAGPFDLTPGPYAIEARLVDREGDELGVNRWDFDVLEHDSGGGGT